jgi:hypothetical protein
MKLVKLKVIKIFSDGSLDFSYKCFVNKKQFTIFEKDNKNLNINKKKILKKINFESYIDYKKKYLI